MSRIFSNIKKKLKKKYFFNEKYLILNDDAFKILKQLPDQSINLIIADPPYHTTKKANIIGDKDFDTDQEFINWIEKFIIESKRLLKKSGSLYLFCSSKISSRLEVMVRNHMNIISNITWTKPNDPGFDGWKQKVKIDNLRGWYNYSEKIIHAEISEKGNLRNSYFGNFLKKARQQSGMSTIELAEITKSYGKINHGGAISNWEAGRNIPSRTQYELLSKALKKKSKIKFPKYNDIIRPFNLNDKKNFTDVWDFPNVRPYKGKHPAEKPLELIDHIIKSSSFKNDLVLDPFAGSFSTVKSALKNSRIGIGIEIDKNLCKKSLVEIDSKKIKFLSDYNKKSKNQNIIYEGLFKNLK